MSYYRLKQTDYDGQFEYSGLVELNNKYIGNVVSYNVTYSNNWITLRYETNKNTNYNLYVYDIAGKVVKHDRIFSDLGINEYSMKTKRYQSGTYFITIQNQSEVYSDKFTVE